MDSLAVNSVVFCGYQLLGSNPFGLAVCLHEWRNSDRERKSLYSFYVVDVFEDIARHISPEGAIAVLEKMRRYWNTVPTKRIDIRSWYPVVCNLINTVNQSPSAKRHFRERYPDLLCLQPICSIRERNRRSQARTWLSNQEKHYKLVQSTFCRLGYPTLEDVCEAHGGFVVDDSPTANENRCFEVLEGLIGTLYDGFFIQETVPARKVIRNIRAVYHGMATLHKVRKGKTNNRGLLIRYEVGEIYLKESVFTVGGFFDAVATYVHESCHAFGGDTSESFGSALTYAMELLLTKHELVEDHKRQWCEVFAGAMPATQEEQPVQRFVN